MELEGNHPRVLNHYRIQTFLEQPTMSLFALSLETYYGHK